MDKFTPHITGVQAPSVAMIPTATGTGQVIVRGFPFTYATPGLLTGAAIYTPTVGEVMLDAWLEIDTLWDTGDITPLFDFGTFNSTTSGLFSFAIANAGSGSQGLEIGNQADSEECGGGMLVGNVLSSLSGAMAVGNAQAMGSSTDLRNGTRTVPLKFIAADPILVVVSGDGTSTGPDPGSTQGAAILYLVLATPV